MPIWLQVLLPIAGTLAGVAIGQGQARDTARRQWLAGELLELYSRTIIAYQHRNRLLKRGVPADEQDGDEDFKRADDELLWFTTRLGLLASGKVVSMAPQNANDMGAVAKLSEAARLHIQDVTGGRRMWRNYNKMTVPHKLPAPTEPDVL